MIPFLSYIVLGGVSFLIWWRAKAPAALLMMVGFGVMWLMLTFNWFGIFGYKQMELAGWLTTLGLGVAAAGFALTFWTKIQADVERFRDLAKDKIAHAANRGVSDAPGHDATPDNKED